MEEKVGVFIRDVHVAPPNQVLLDTEMGLLSLDEKVTCIYQNLSLTVVFLQLMLFN